MRKRSFPLRVVGSSRYPEVTNNHLVILVLFLLCNDEAGHVSLNMNLLTTSVTSFRRVKVELVSIINLD